MEENELLELEHIGGLIDSIEEHWDFLNGNYPTFENVPAFLFPPGFMRQLCEDRRQDEVLRRELRLDPAFVCPAAQIVDALCDIAYRKPHDYRNARDSMRRASAANAYMLAKKACEEALSKAELNRLGWELTRLVALDVKPIKTALLALQVKGGVESGKARREANAGRDAAICEEGRRLLVAGFGERDLAGIIANQATGCGLSQKRIGQILVAGGVKRK